MISVNIPVTDESSDVDEPTTKMHEDKNITINIHYPLLKITFEMSS